MTHPLIPPLLELARPVAQSLGLELVGAVFQTHYSPPVLRVDVRNLQSDTGLEDCEQMSRALEAALDGAQLIPDAYVLEVSSPGIARELERDREFISFKGFPVTVTALAADGKSTSWTGSLVGRDADFVRLNQKGRPIKVPRTQVVSVLLTEE
jgi:ribosome maturation factor RimP